MNWRPIPAAILVLFAFAATSCGVPADSAPHLVPQDGIPDALNPSDTAPSTSVAEQERVTLWFVRDAQLSSVRHSVPAPTDATQIVDELLAGPTDPERSDTLRSAIPDAAAVDHVTIAGGEATVVLAPEFSEIPAADQLLAVGQLVLTLTDLRGVGRVRFAVGDTAVAIPLPTGGISTASVSRDDYIALTRQRP